MVIIITETQRYILSVEYSMNTTFVIEWGKRVMCPASAKTVDVLAVRYVKQGIEDAGFRAGLSAERRRRRVILSRRTPPVHPRRTSAYGVYFVISK